MTKGKKTTQQERAEIVAFCLEHGKDYLLTIERMTTVFVRSECGETYECKFGFCHKDKG